MKITELAIKLRTSVLVLTGMITLGGLVAYVSLPKESNPSIEVPNIVVTSIYPGATPNDIESLVTQPIEDEIKGLSGIEKITSTSVEGVSTIVVAFSPGVSMGDANSKVREKVDLAKKDLPAEVEEPIVSEIDLSEFPILTINLAANYPLSQLKRVAEDVEDAVEAIPSVLQVDLIGGREREVQVLVDLARLKAYNIAFEDLTKTLTGENQNVPGGSIDVGHMNYLVRVDGQFKSPAEIEDLVVKIAGDRPILVRDVAQVQFGFKDAVSQSRLRVLRVDAPKAGTVAAEHADKKGDARGLLDVNQQGYKAVISLNVKKRAGENILDTSDEVEALIKGFNFPEGTEVLITGDQSVQVRAMVKDLENNIIAGLVFVVAVLLFFLGVRTAVLVGVAIPISLMLSFIVFMVMGQTLNFIILFSLIIALGMLVDNAIVIVENIYRYLEEGATPFEAAAKGTGEVGLAVVASTATTVAVFAPMMFWPGIIGEFMGFMPLTLMITLSASLFVAILINPVITGYFARVDGRKYPRARRATKVIGLILLVLGAVITAMGNRNVALVLFGGGGALVVLHLLVFRHVVRWCMNRGLPALVDFYRRFLRWMLVRDYTARFAMVRNTLALGSMTAGVLLLVLGGTIYALAGPAAGMLLVYPGGGLAVLGLALIMLHTVESVLIGGGYSVLAGLALGLMSFLVMVVMTLAGNPPDEKLKLLLMALPAAIAVLGLPGMVLRRFTRRLILTDNRARLMTGVFGTLVLIIMAFFVAPTGVEFFPDTDPTQVQVSVSGPLGANLDEGSRLAEVVTARIESLLADNPTSESGVKNLVVNVGVGGDTMFGGGAASPEKSTITLNLVDYEDRNEPSRETLIKLRDQLQGLPGADIEFTKDQQGPPTGPPVNIEISGKDFNEVVRISGELVKQIKSLAETGKVPGLVDIRDNLNTGRPEMEVVVDRARAAQFGISTGKVANMIRTAVNGLEASKWRDREDEYDITVRLRPEDRGQLESLRDLTIMHEGTQIPLMSVAEFKIGSGLGSVTRKDGQRVVTVMANVREGFNKQEVLAMVQANLGTFEKGLPLGYSMRYTGENEDQAKSFGFLTKALGAGIALIMMILIAQFNSVALPFLIMVAVGLSMVGVLLGLLLTGTAFGLFTFIGVISLAGIVVNNNIVLIDYTLQLRERGMDKTKAIIEAGATRLRPVLLTALTTVLGLIPLTFGINIDFLGLLTDLDPDLRIGSPNTQFWGPMGIAIISGLTFATFLTLIIVPVMYSVFDSVSVRLSGLFKPRPLTEAEGGDPEGGASDGGEAARLSLGKAKADDASDDGPVPAPA